MKHRDVGQESPSRETLARLAQIELSELGVLLDTRSIELCCGYLLAILSANRKVNITAVKEPRQAVRLHVVDSLAVLPDLNAAPPGSVCDIGSGGGFPGVPLCVATGRPGIMLDSVRRKVEAVSSAIASCSIQNVEAVCDRAELLALRSEGNFAAVTARAVAELPVLVEYAAPLLAFGGILLALKGSASPEEVDRGLRAAATCGLSLTSCRDYALPRGNEARQVFSFERTSEPLVVLPRDPGRARKRPLV